MADNTIPLEPVYKHLYNQFKKDFLSGVEGLSRTKDFDYLRQVYPILSSLRIALGACGSQAEFIILRDEYDAVMGKVYDNLTRLQDKADGIEEDNG